MGVGTPACSKFYVAIDNAACSPLGIVIIDKCFKVYSVIVHLWVNLHSVMPFVANFLILCSIVLMTLSMTV